MLLLCATIGICLHQTLNKNLEDFFCNLSPCLLHSQHHRGSHYMILNSIEMFGHVICFCSCLLQRKCPFLRPAAIGELHPNPFRTLFGRSSVVPVGFWLCFCDCRLAIFCCTVERSSEIGMAACGFMKLQCMTLKRQWYNNGANTLVCFATFF